MQKYDDYQKRASPTEFYSEIQTPESSSNKCIEEQNIKWISNERIKKVALQVRLPRVEKDEIKHAQYRLSRKKSNRKRNNPSKNSTPQLRAHSHSLMTNETIK